MSDGDLISELYASCFRRLVVQLYAVTGDLSEAQEAVQEAFLLAISSSEGTEPDRLGRLLVSRDDGRHVAVAREYGPSVGAISVAPGYAWLYGRDGPTGEPDHVLVTTDATSWSRFALKP